MDQRMSHRLSEQDVSRLAECAGIALDPEDLPGMAAELGALIDGLSPLAAYMPDFPCEGERDLRE